MFEIITRIINSLHINSVKYNSEAPSTFLIPISLVLCSAVKEAKPKSPKHAIIIAITAIPLIMQPFFLLFYTNTQSPHQEIEKQMDNLEQQQPMCFSWHR